MKREHSTPGPILATAVALMLLLPGTYVGGKETTWWELRDLPLESLTLAPTTAERLGKATVILVSAGALHPSGNGYDMDVRAWTEVQLQGVGPEPFCQPLDNLDLLFYGQSELAVSTCSGFLVAPDLVITAGHCIDTPDCTDKYAVFDFADQGPPPPGGQVHLTQDQVRQCEEVLVDTFPGTADLPTEPKGGLDWALLRLEEPVDLSQRTPLALDRFSPIEADDTMLVMGYPNGLSLKAEVVEHRPGAALVVLAHALTGSSGSPTFNLETGKASQMLTVAGGGWVTQQPGPPACHDPCFECDGEGAGGDLTSMLTSPDLPILGLQIATGGSGSLVQHYGPPTIGADFDTWSVTVSVEDPLEPLAEVSWAMVEENPTGPPFLDVLEGSTSGSLMAGESETITVRPSDATVASPGLLQRIIPLFDYSFGTRDPITHEVYVGIDGYTVVPASEIAGRASACRTGRARSSRWRTAGSSRRTSKCPGPPTGSPLTAPTSPSR